VGGRRDLVDGDRIESALLEQPQGNGRHLRGHHLGTLLPQLRSERLGRHVDLLSVSQPW
jgi:hypothetical protein